jgi:large subunit ribosomal protein L23
MNLYDIIRRPLDTEKFDRARDQHNQYAFEVDKKATKLQVKYAVENIFKVSLFEGK